MDIFMKFYYHPRYGGPKILLLRFIFHNLMENFIQFMKHEGAAHISLG